MEEHRCRLCFRNFANGKALGGHMRSHLMNLHASSKAKQEKENTDDHNEISEEEIVESVPSLSSEDEDEENENKGLFSYGVNHDHQISSPKKKIGLVDSEFCSVVLQDRESETESSKNPTCRRSKRVRKSRISDAKVLKKPKSSEKQGRFSYELVPFLEADQQPVSSISDTTPEEDVAHCLMMLSRDKWKKEDNFEEEEVDHEEHEQKKNYYHDFGVVKVTKSRRTRGKYRCEACNKVFRSYQALGGHRASHKRIKVLISNSTEEQGRAAEFSSGIEGKIHECPVCYRIFSSGQALGGHKRTHVMGTPASHVSISHSTAKPFSRFGETLIDLNLPAPIDDQDDYDVSQIELSAVSDAEFVNNFK